MTLLERNQKNQSEAEARLAFRARQERLVSPSPDASVTDRRGLAQVLDKICAALTPQERRDLDLRLGLDPARREHKFSEIGLKLGVSRSRAHALVQQALRRLQSPWAQRCARAWLDDGRFERARGGA